MDQIGVLDIADDANDGDPRRAGVAPDALA